MENFKLEIFFEAIKLFGGFAGLVTLCWKLMEELDTFLRIKVETKRDNGNYTILTEIENANRISSKVIENAFLLITPENYDLVKAGQLIAEKINISYKVEKTDDFESLTSIESVYLKNQIVFIPLQFYFIENENIADEKLTYRCFIDHTKLLKGKYSVRFYIYGKKRLHRSTQDLLIIS